jgi:uncharacterized membrane protein
MNKCKILIVFGLAALGAWGCENKTTTTGSAPPAAMPGKSSSAVKKLTLKAAAEQTIKQGDSHELTIKIDRSNFDDPVTVHLNDLPQGVTCSMNEVIIPAGATETKVTLKVAPDAVVGEHDVKIDAKAPGLDENVQTMKLTVKDKG